MNRAKAMSPDRLYRAARAVDTLPARERALRERRERAESLLAAAVLAHGRITVGDYTVTLDHDTVAAGNVVTVGRADMIAAAQLALWAVTAHYWNVTEPASPSAVA